MSNDRFPEVSVGTFLKVIVGGVIGLVVLLPAMLLLLGVVGLLLGLFGVVLGLAVFVAKLAVFVLVPVVVVAWVVRRLLGRHRRYEASSGW